ncbi:DUF484 family protein [Ketogulonicigenium vulgare]|uniref:Site-specific tyrosine recombinase XerC n=1 Tax=Ketogulonicigenium vulgare (strain WSH-001) TaxID=759362 RepID=F9Y7E8_KETVW|nr:DUF484 family protein [Ketogulonicigenium vulgare]ADO42890.1 conserved hypothetical protein [Ketogulonicigenium vulgare Y25]AEM41076.1 Site-specific tyrosine recombinase XerC [Ketogulonicigenium vulgare WSH-001]ALJ81219.1 recombinase XerC [Ketogulonicigenium vulgare]ANW33962.1 recombinase XerC [Ketogulonicigenium vulgare]AOZ54801.1 hypothetical protein KVC_1790 [Ketogulonicigenium vulgare]
MSQDLSSLDAQTRARILADPAQLLEDQDIMRALVAANDKAMGQNVIDLRGIAMERLEERLDRLEDAHRSVIAAAYENLAGTNMIHRAALALLEPLDFNAFLHFLAHDLPGHLRLDNVQLVLEGADGAEGAIVGRIAPALVAAGPGFVDHYLTEGRSHSPRPVTLRQIAYGIDALYGDKANHIQSEACLRLDLGEGRRPGLVLLGSEDPHHFDPQHGTELLHFFGSVFERSMRRWLT